jgi:spore coat polysaccharide biosynthesis predicted glycosyltransferase SpsG
MRYILRSDASPAQGVGHVLRSLAIFQELNARGCEIIFVGKIENLPWVEEKMKQTGFKYLVDSEKNFLHNPQTDILILDSYEVDPQSAFIENTKWSKIVTIVDDFTPTYSSDLIVCPSISTVTNSLVGTKVLSGPSYFPLRNEIRKSTSNNNHRSVFSVVVLGGGTDVADFASAISLILEKSSFEMSVTFITEKCAKIAKDNRFTTLPPGLEVEKTLSKADLAFTTASTSAIEFIAREIPVGVACAVPNQEDYYQVLPNNGVAVQIGRMNGENWEFHENVILDLLVNQRKQIELRDKMKGMFDLKGASRIVDEILKL